MCKAASKVKLLISYGNTWSSRIRSRQGVRILYTFLVPILVPIPAKRLITLKTAGIPSRYPWDFRCQDSIHFCRLETLSEDRRSFKCLIVMRTLKLARKLRENV